jgi:hypothetical protein
VAVTGPTVPVDLQPGFKLYFALAQELAREIDNDGLFEYSLSNQERKETMASALITFLDLLFKELIVFGDTSIEARLFLLLAYWR